MRRFLAALVILLCAAWPAAAEEVIESFFSDVTVNVDGSLDVVETIRVRAEGREIRRGILRDFPTTYKDKNGMRVRVGFDVADVQRDGRRESYIIESISGGKRIRIGNKDVFLEFGPHTYKINYRTTRQIGFFDRFDELYWNVTGNGWTFPILKASTIIRLPEDALVGQNTVYTGYLGANGRDARVTAASGNRFQAETTRRLEASEGFTVSVAWPKGIVAPPTEAQKQRDWLMDNLGYFVLALTLLGVPLYYVFTWLRVGRDPQKGTIVPLFKPPDGMGPAGVRYIYKHGFDDKAVAASLVNLAVQKRVQISEDDGTYAVQRLSSDSSGLTRTDAALLTGLPSSKLELEQTNHSSVRNMRNALDHAVDEEYDGVMFLKNFKWFLLGFLLSALGMLGALFLMPSDDGGALIALGGFTFVWWGVVLAVGYGVVSGLFTAHGWAAKIRSIMGLIFLVPFVGAGIAVPSFAMMIEGVSSSMKWVGVAAVLLALCNLIFYWLLKAPTVKGRAMLDQIEGFRMYLMTAEEERLKVLHPPEKTPALFERYLPYAMALDCENQWNDKFAAVLAAAAVAGASGTAIGSWYDGTGGFSSRGFTNDLGNSIASSISSSGVAPGSSSGSGGGGSSGGGGGGGGGSGW